VSRVDLIAKVNAAVNQFPYSPDWVNFSLPDLWRRISEMKRGDCDDYACEKRFRLMEAGIPWRDLRFATCFVETGERHLILLVKGEKGGDWILDNRQPGIFGLDEFHGLGYRGESIQRPGEWLWDEWETPRG
jgi:predicted transglutaminase-like cysteine proteinase